ncbi:hypothetical protein [Ancylomarina longa]|uniref:Uncharacterized protein n=1 Tax=Ancylomarina longa TaxID=2487017 RepID=A0A434AGC2_9BACT|nr:hypothetical protein [Ancylomarina longa]RUT73425.1 hypothetical protein DLK05_13160 [Ancylomarina longa]
MKDLIYISCLVLIISFTNCHDPNRIRIKPGIGIDDISFEHSEPEDIFNYKGLYYSVREGTGHADGYDFSCYDNWKKYTFDNLGITFTFSTPCVENPDTFKLEFVNISLVNTPNAYLKNGIGIGKSKYEDVIKIYGKPSEDWENESFLSYDSPKIDFSFNEEGILYWVKIFRRNKKSKKRSEK